MNIQPISVVIVNYNAGELLFESVATALAQAEQVIVVDNDSSDTSMDMLAKKFPEERRLVLHYAGNNLGFAGGCNLGANIADQPNLLFLNPDCLLGEGSLQRMLDVLNSDSTIGMVGGLLTNLDGSEQGGGRRAMLTPWRAFVRAFGLHRFSRRWPKLFFDFHLHSQPLPESPVEVDAISGALMLVRKAAIDNVGLWDEEYFLHCEDLDWCIRFRQKGWKIVFVPNAKVMHDKGACSRSRPVLVEWYKHKGMVRYYRKFFSNEYSVLLMWLVVAGVWMRFGLVALYYIMRKAGQRLGLLRE